MADNSKESFICSITNIEKYTLQSPEYALYLSKDRGPYFGGGPDLSIDYDYVNSRVSASTFIGSRYSNDKYKSCDTGTRIERLTGDKGSAHLYIREW